MHPKLPSINGLRAISILLVISHHLSIQNRIYRDIEKNTFIKPVVDFIQDGHLGVNIFFVISGFLITFLLLREEQEAGKISIQNFYIRRTLRIFPVYYFLLLVYFFLQLGDFLWIRPLSWVAAAVYMKDFYSASDWYTAHLWSLGVEEKFYLLWPFIFAAGGLTRKSAVISVVLIVPLIRIYLYLYPNTWIGEMNIFTRIDAIALGCVIALYQQKFISALQNYWRIAFYSSIVMLFLIPYLPGLLDIYDLNKIFIALGGTHGTIANILIAIILLYSVFGPQGLWFKFLNTRVLNFIGMLSYSIYIWQQLFIINHGRWWQHYPYNLLFISVAALLSFYFIEKPFLLLKSRFVKTD